MIGFHRKKPEEDAAKMSSTRKGNREKKDKKESHVAGWILDHIPAGIRRRWTRRLENTFRDHTINSRENRAALKEFQLRQIRIIYRGMLAFIVMVIFLCLYFRMSARFTFMRNPFGMGEKEIRLDLKYQGREEGISFTLEEQELSPGEQRQVFAAFFRKLRQEIRGENGSLDKVNLPLDFRDELEGYPFFISYEPEDPFLINWDGSPGEKALALKEGEKARTEILVKAEYKGYSSEERIGVTLIPQGKEELSLFDRFQNMLVKKESSTRKQEDFPVDSSWKGISIRDPSSDKLWKIPLLILICTGLLLIRGHTSIRERNRIRHRQNMEDFPMIVHLLTLYMGVGLSFPSAVSRMLNDYDKRIKPAGERYAFEQIRVMDHCLHMGLRPGEVCLEWGRHFPEKVYAKFAMLLSQGFSKGAKEIRSMMEKEQEDAFRVQVDFVRREGEEASTRLVFPMIVLLSIVMVLVMFPALMQFYGM